ncbi:hypothetical protein ACTXT7_006798 [Hymenolepis weldensis]
MTPNASVHPRQMITKSRAAGSHMGVLVMCEVVNLIVAPGSLRLNIVCPQVAHPYRSEKLTKCTSDNSCRGTADSEIFRNQSRPHYPFLFLQPSRLLKAHIQLCPRAPPHSN